MEDLGVAHKCIFFCDIKNICVVKVPKSMRANIIIKTQSPQCVGLGKTDQTNEFNADEFLSAKKDANWDNYAIMCEMPLRQVNRTCQSKAYDCWFFRI